MTALAVGCSHTVGVGIDTADNYVSQLEKYYGFLILNRGVSGGSSNDVLMNIVTAIKNNHHPTFIIAQWPDPFRRTTWINGKAYLQNINSCDASFNLLVKNDCKNFYEPWLQSIIVANLLCRLAQTTIINIMLETLDSEYLDRLLAENIMLYHDEKLPGRSWIFDNEASDGLHHSAQCHQAWAKRLIGIIDEHTTP
jgi:lysophospholipase L1-like esterase